MRNIKKGFLWYIRFPRRIEKETQNILKEINLFRNHTYKTLRILGEMFVALEKLQSKNIIKLENILTNQKTIYQKLEVPEIDQILAQIQQIHNRIADLTEIIKKREK